MATVRSLKFNDNVLQVQDSYKIDNYSPVYDDTNVHIGHVYLADHCGNLVIQSDQNSASNLTVTDNCGYMAVKVGAFTEVDYPAIAFSENDEKKLIIGAQCGNFTVSNGSGSSMFTFDQCGELSWYDCVYGNIGVRLDGTCGNCFYIKDSCGDTMMAVNNGGIHFDSLAIDTCGGALNLSNSCGNIFFVGQYDGHSWIETYVGAGNNLWLGEKCGDVGVGYYNNCVIGVGQGNGVVYAGPASNYYSANVSSGFFAGSGIWLEDVSGLRLGCGTVSVDSNGFLKWTAF